MAFEQDVVSSMQEADKSDKSRSRVAKGIAAVGLSTAAVFNMAPANADEVVLFCGAGDPACNIEGHLRDRGYIAPEDTVHRVPGPYEMGPIMPIGAPHSTQQSVDIAAANARNMLPNIKPAPGEDLTFMGYSVGTIPASVLANEHSVDGRLREGVRNVNVNGPVTAEGVFENEIVKMFDPIVKLLDIPTDVRAPAGSELYGHEGDVWAYSAHSDLMELMQQGIDTMFGPVHAVQEKSGLSIKWVGPDGVEYTKFIGPAQGAAPGTLTMGGPASAEAIAPIEDPNLNPAKYNPVRNQVPTPPERYVPPAAPVALPTPKAIVVPPPPVPGVPLTPEQHAFLDQFSSAVGGIK